MAPKTSPRLAPPAGSWEKKGAQQPPTLQTSDCTMLTGAMRVSSLRHLQTPQEQQQQLWVWPPANRHWSWHWQDYLHRQAIQLARRKMRWCRTEEFSRHVSVQSVPAAPVIQSLSVPKYTWLNDKYIKLSKFTGDTFAIYMEKLLAPSEILGPKRDHEGVAGSLALCLKCWFERGTSWCLSLKPFHQTDRSAMM